MDFKGRFKALGLFLVVVGMSYSTQAAERLNYNAAPSRYTLEKIKTFYSGRDLPHLAMTDLNKDGLEEFIAKPSNCGAHASCEYNILAESKDTVVSLGKIKATDILLGNEFKHGVRNLLIYNSAVNDFAYDVYAWHPETSKYAKVP